MAGLVLLAALSLAHAEDPEPAPLPSVPAKLALTAGETFGYTIDEWVRVKDNELGFVWQVAVRVDKLPSGGAADLTLKLVSVKVKGAEEDPPEFAAKGETRISLAATGVPKKVGKDMAEWFGSRTKKAGARNAKAFLAMLFPPRPKQDAEAGATWKAKREMRTTLLAGAATLSLLDEVYTVEKIENSVATIAVAGSVTMQVTHKGDKTKKGDKRLRGLKPSGKLTVDTKSGRVLEWRHAISDSELFGRGTHVKAVDVSTVQFDD